MKRNRKRTHYFTRMENVPAPVVVETGSRVHFSEIDLMAFVWYGRYASYFEKGAEALGRVCGLSYKDFHEAHLRAPFVEFHVDYFKPLHLDEEFTIRTVLVWNRGARLDTEYYILKNDGSIAASGYSVQLFIDVQTGEICLTSPEMLERCRSRWEKGEFHCTK